MEDDPVSGAALCAILRCRGFEVTHVTTVAQGLEGLAGQPSIVLLDLMLPDGDGAVILKHIHKHGLKMRVMVTTAINDNATLKAVGELQPEILMQKPIDISVLLTLMEPVH